MRKRLTALIISFLLFLPFVSSVSAQVEEQSVESSTGVSAPDYIIPPVPRPEPGFLGQDHAYTVVFRGNGEAVVSVRVVFTNRGEEDLTEMSLRVPRVNPSQISVYQVIREPRCIRYKPREIDPVTRLYKPQECAEYQDPDYYQSYYSGAKYQKAESELDIDTIKVTLPVAVKPNKSGSFFVYFRAMGYAKKNVFGGYKYTFESLKVEDDIRSLRAGIGTDSDLILRGAKGEVSYRFEEPQLAGLEAAGAPAKSVSVDRYISQIGSGRITKSASNLAPLESYEVSGSYAKNRLILFAKEIVIVALIALIILVISGLIIRIIYKKLYLPTKQLKTATPIPQTGQLILVTGGLGFVASILIAGYTVLVIFLGALMSSIITYRYNSVLILFLILISFGVYVLLLFGPGIYLGVKKGIGWGIATMVFTVFWLIGFLVIAILIIFLLGGSGSGGGIIVPLLQSLGV